MSTHPCLRSRIAGIAICVRCSGASTCISSMSRARFSGNSSSGRRNVTAALFTRMSGAPTCSITSAMRPFALLALDRSACIATAFPPAARIPSSVSRNDPTYFGSGSIVRAVSATVAPSAANRLATALPSPRLAPVTNATFPSHPSGMSPRYYAHGRAAARPRRPARSARAARRRRRRTARRRRVEPDVLGARRGPAGRGQGRATWACRRSSIATCCARRGCSGRCTAPPCRCPKCCGRTPATRPTCHRCSSCPSWRARRWSRCSISTATTPSRSWRNACATRPGRSRRCTPSTPLSIGLGAEPVVGPQAEIDRWCRLLETVDPRPRSGLGRRGRRAPAREPPPMPAAVVHGDFRLGNLLAVGAAVTAVVDWEIWTVGDPRIDLGWFLANADPATYQRPTRYAGAAAVTGRAARRLRRSPRSRRRRRRVVPGVGVLQVDRDVVADRQAQPPPRRARP